VVQSWISRELSPVAQARQIAERLISRLRSEEEEGAETRQTVELAALQLVAQQGRTFGLIALVVSVISLGVLIWMAVR
jgi:ubiquinone biosynthesis protein